MDCHEVGGHEVIEAQAKHSGNGAHVYVPKAWAGSTVKVVRVTDLSDE